MMFLLPPRFKPSFHEFCYGRLCGMKFEPLVGMYYLCVWVCDYFGGMFSCKLVGIAFGLGVQQLTLCWYWSYAWFWLPVFGLINRFRDVLVRTAGIWCENYLYSSRCTTYAWRADVFGDSSEMELRFYDVILGMDWLSRPRVVLDCLRARVPINEADGSFYCMHAICRGVIRYMSIWIFGDHFDG